MTPELIAATEATFLRPMRPPRGHITTLFAAMLGALVIVGLIVPADDGWPHGGGHRREEEVVIASEAVKRYGHEAFPQWAAAHPGRGCPSSLRELDRPVS